MTRALAIAIALLWAGEAAAQAKKPCGAHSAIAEHLAKKYGEKPVSLGVQSNGHLLEVYASQSGGTWTAVTTTPTRISCIVAAGKRWESRPYPSADPKA